MTRNYVENSSCIPCGLFLTVPKGKVLMIAPIHWRSILGDLIANSLNPWDCPRDPASRVRRFSYSARISNLPRTAGTKPWTVDCSLHPWLQGHRPFAGTIVTISPSGRSVHWSKRNRNPGDEGASGQSRPSNDERNAWLGRSVDGVWDVVENTLVNRVAARAVAGLLENCGAAVCIGEEESPEGSGQIGLQGTDDAGLRAKL